MAFAFGHNEPTGITPVSISTDNASGDAFGRLRTSGTGQRLDIEFLYDKQPEFFDEITSNGTVTFDKNARDLTLSIDGGNWSDSAEMRSHPVPYTPGNSQLIDITGVLNFARLTGGTTECFLRSTISGVTQDLEIITQDDWADTVEDADWTAAHIFSIDFQSLKVGRIRFNMVRDGAPVFLAQITNDNIRSSGYWQLASLPVYWTWLK